MNYGFLTLNLATPHCLNGCGFREFAARNVRDVSCATAAPPPNLPPQRSAFYIIDVVSKLIVPLADIETDQSVECIAVA